MTFETLLPPHATDLERAFEQATGLTARIPSQAYDASLKLDAYEPFIPWLIWEYGLGEILPYLTDPQRAIQEGIQWQRARGTPAALRIAFGWRGLDGVSVFQEEPGRHFSAFQIDTGAVPPITDVDDLIALARLSAPIRSRLSRIYHDYDMRRFKLDDTRLGDGLLSDYSGVWHADGKTRLSFGRTFKAETPIPETWVHPIISVDHGTRAFLAGRMILSVDCLDDARHTANPYIYHAHLFVASNAEGVPASPARLLPFRKFQRAQIALSEDIRFGEINLRTPPPDHIFYDHRDILSDDVPLSDARADPRITRITAVFERQSVFGIAAALAPSVVACQAADRVVTHGGAFDRVTLLSEQRREIPPVAFGAPAPIRAETAYGVQVCVFQPVRIDGRLSDAARFRVKDTARADARDVADNAAWTGTNPQEVAASDEDTGLADAFRLTRVSGGAAYAGQFWLPLNYMPEDWVTAQVLIGSMHRTET
jgi:P2-related tail formation protein